MNYIYKIIFVLLLHFPIYILAQGPGTETIPGTGAPGNQYDTTPPTPCDDVIGSGWETNGCGQDTTGAPGTHVPINDYIPLLALVAITIGGITFYRHQKQII